MMQDLKAKFVNVSREAMDRAKDIAGKAVDAGKNGVKWVIENPDKAAAGAAAGAALFGGANKLVRSVNRNVTARRELRDKKIRIYDRSLGMFIYAKKPMDGDTVDRIYAKKRETGKRICEIMAEEGLLRKGKRR